MAHPVDILQVLLPDSLSILSASIPAHRTGTTASDLVRSLLGDAANAETLARVFGYNYEWDAVAHDQRGTDHGTWWIDARGMPWALQTVESSPANREWTQDDLDSLGDGECAAVLCGTLNAVFYLC